MDGRTTRHVNNRRKKWVGHLHTQWQLSKSDHKNIPRHRTENSLHTHQYQTCCNQNHLTGNDIIGIYKLNFGYLTRCIYTKLHFTSRTSSTRMCRGGQTSRIMPIRSTPNVLKTDFEQSRLAAHILRNGYLQNNKTHIKKQNAIPVDELM